MEVCDVYGTIWRYDKQLNSWINIGTIGDSSVVTDTQDGLVSPPIFTRLSAISSEIQNGLKFDFLKIYPHLSGYYYLFQSSNHTITLEPESAHDLRMEVSRPRLLALLSQLKCPGEQGLVGEQGDTGAPGSPGEPEKKYPASISGSRMSIDVAVDDSLGTPISLRLFASYSSTPSVVIKIVGSEFEVISSSIVIDVDSTFLEYVDGQLSGQIVSQQWSTFTWHYKALQMGKKGPVGEDGHNFISVVSDNIVDDNLRSSAAIILLRHGDGIDVINYLSANLFKTNCVSKLAVSHICATTTISLTDSYAALQISTDNCKSITRYIFKPVVIEIPNLVLSEWTPTSTCLRQRHLAASRLMWPDYTKVDSGMLPWQKANKSMAEDPGYPWSIVEESDPGQLCCQEDFFFCSNVNDVTGACPVTLVDSIQTPPASTFGCDCDCPISFLLEGGYEFEDVKAIAIGDISSQAAVCSLNGGLHEYNAIINVSTVTPVLIAVTWKLEYDDICDDARTIYQSQNSTIPGFTFDPRVAVSQSNCPIGWAVTDKSIASTTLERQACDSRQSLSNIGFITYYFKGTSGTIAISAEINTLRLNCCLGYKITVSSTVLDPATTTVGNTCSAEITLSQSPSPSPSISPSASLSPSVSLSPSASLSLSPSFSPSASLSLSPSLSPSASESPSLSLSLSPSVSESPSLSPSPSPSVSESPSLSPSPSPSVSESPSLTPSLSS
jgi:hypothetical protein